MFFWRNLLFDAPEAVSEVSTSVVLEQSLFYADLLSIFMCFWGLTFHSIVG